MVYLFLTTCMQLHDQLKSLGLNSSECSVYLFLLQSGSTTPPDVSQGTGISRTNCYHLFTSLIEKQLIEERLDGKRKVYIARHPSAVLDMLKKQQSAAEQLLPDLEALYTPHKNKPQINYLAGWDEIRKIFHEALGAAKIAMLGDFKPIEAATGMLLPYFREEIAKRGIQLNERSRNIVSQETDNLSGSGISSDTACIVIWGNATAFITATEPAFATIIRNKAISETFYTLF